MTDIISGSLLPKLEDQRQLDIDLAAKIPSFNSFGGGGYTIAIAFDNPFDRFKVEAVIREILDQQDPEKRFIHDVKMETIRRSLGN